MCGLIGVFNTAKEAEPVNEQALMHFEDQRKRGTEGFGIITIDPKMAIHVERATEPYKFMWDIHSNISNMMIVHHRTPTSTDNLIGQTHPIVVTDGSLKHDYLVTHNGIVSNDEDLKEEHESLGFNYSTRVKTYYVNDAEFNDSEAFAIELARFIEGQVDKMNLQGSAAFIALQVNKKTGKVKQLFFGRTTNAVLKMSKTRNKLVLSSEGQGQPIVEKTLYSCELKEKMKLRKTKLVIAERTIPNYPTSSRADYTDNTHSLEEDDEKATPSEIDHEESIVEIIDEAETNLKKIVEEYVADISSGVIPTPDEAYVHLESMKDIMDGTQKDIENAEVDYALAKGRESDPVKQANLPLVGSNKKN